ncbi:BQ5605_C011g06296 [Microbotryum silenes-dioicae]|uniref:BQ5605_C011g06296 protein n=1 Tax=Microbotryum silenes-dioicae TaxID=796604 RepID=A0A2X0LNN1_9BASI|nr:BQ5605_C011g06296 [Microbotryum silenes-dioicae]
MYTKVAPLGKDLEIILGGNFIYRHKMELGLFPQPHLTCKANPIHFIDLLALSSQPVLGRPLPVQGTKWHTHKFSGGMRDPVTLDCNTNRCGYLKLPPCQP